jgi:hypothetical protein
MRTPRRRVVVCLLAAMLLVLAAPTSEAQQRAKIAEELAKTYGLDSFHQVEAIRYTWHAEFPGVNVARSWVWHPKTGQVSYEGKDKDGKPVKVTYRQSELNKAPANVKDEIEPSFINDQYWLVFPYHVQWDSSASVQDTGSAKLPLGSGSARRLVMKYPAEAGGYTPGDTWEVFLGPDNRVREFIYRRAGPKKPSVVIATYADHKKAGPLLVAMDHRGTADGKPLRIWFTDVAVQLTGSSNWVAAQ